MQAILFDWDGTLADSLEGFYLANAAVMARFGLPFDRRRYRAAYTADWRVFYLRLGIPDDRLEEANELWTAAFVPAARPMPGALEALEALAAHGLRLGLVTATGRSIVEPQLERFGMSELLALRVCAEDAPAMKPDPAPLRQALDALGMLDRPADTTYVGDAPDDMRMARTVGARAIAVPSMLGGEAELRAAGADEIHPSVAAWVASLLGRPTVAA